MSDPAKPLNKSEESSPKVIRKNITANSQQALLAYSHLMEQIDLYHYQNNMPLSVDTINSKFNLLNFIALKA